MRRKLGVNIDHVGTLRQKRKTVYPDPVAMASHCEQAGADLITVHLREDRRHIQERDLRLLRQTIQTSLNIKIAASQDMLKLVYDIKPDQVILLKERREEDFTEGGLDVLRHRDHLKGYIQGLHDADIGVGLLIAPDIDQVKAAHKVGAQSVELYTGKYGRTKDNRERREELQRIADASRAASKLGMHVVVGHGLHYHNIEELVALPDIREYDVGHALLSHALFVGIDRAVKEMLALLTP
ncbi:pyridoxine 5'-phosphate synthase [Myxococcota bacterium]|nr:pyridoxine 5'-phosphate synthase [Myxococcota bacterium]